MVIGAITKIIKAFDGLQPKAFLMNGVNQHLQYLQ